MVNNKIKTHYVECKKESDSTGKGNRNKVIHKISEQQNMKARNQGTTEKNHAGHCARTFGW